MHEAVVLYTKGDDGVVLGRLGGLEPWDGAGEMAESREQGWPVGGWALLGDRLCRIRFSLLLAGRLFHTPPNQKTGFPSGLPGWDAPLGAVNGKGWCPSINKETEKGTSDPS